MQCKAPFPEKGVELPYARKMGDQSDIQSSQRKHDLEQQNHTSPLLGKFYLLCHLRCDKDLFWNHDHYMEYR